MPVNIPPVIEKSCEDEAIIKFFEKKFKAGSIVYAHGFNKYVLDKEFGNKVIQCLKDGGLYNFLTLGHKFQHMFDATQFYLNVVIPITENKVELDEIRSRVNGEDVTIVHGDIRAVFDFPVRDEHFHPNCSGHDYVKDELWQAIK